MVSFLPNPRFQIVSLALCRASLVTIVTPNRIAMDGYDAYPHAIRHVLGERLMHTRQTAIPTVIWNRIIGALSSERLLRRPAGMEVGLYPEGVAEAALIVPVIACQVWYGYGRAGQSSWAEPR